jgi:hypothetical protein
METLSPLIIIGLILCIPVAILFSVMSVLKFLAKKENAKKDK